MAKKQADKDIDVVLWHSAPKQVSNNGHWRIRYGYRDSAGAEHQTTETVATPAKRDQFIAYLDRKIKDGKKAEKSAPSSDKEMKTVAELLAAYAEVAKRKHTQGRSDGWDEGTYNANKGLIKNYLNPQLGCLRIWEVTSGDLRNGFNRIFEMPRARGNHKGPSKPVSQRTVVDCRKIISKAFKWAVEQEMIEASANPMIGVKLSAPKPKKRKVIPIDLFYQVLERAETHYHEFYIFLIMMSALSSRSGEVYALRWSDVEKLDGEQTIVHVNKELAKRSQEWIDSTRGRGIVQILGSPRSTVPSSEVWVLKSTKTEAEDVLNVDYIYIDAEIANLLEEHKARQTEILRDAPYKDLEMIFCQKNGWPLSEALVNKRFRRILTEVGCTTPKDYSIYCLRHFSITRKLEINGNNYVSLAADTKHTELDTVMQYYHKPEDSVRQHTASMLGDFLLHRDASRPVDTETEKLIEATTDLCNTDSNFRDQLAYIVNLAKHAK